MTLHRLLPLLALIVSAAPARAAAAPPQVVSRQEANELTGWLVLGAGYGYYSGYQSGFGVGGRYRMWLADGIVRDPAGRVRDTFDLEFGADLVRYAYNLAPYGYDYTYWAIRPRVGAMWNFWFSPQFALYPKLDLGYEFGWLDRWDTAYGPRPTYARLFLEPIVGIIYRFRPATSLRVELGSEGAKLGLGFAF